MEHTRSVASLICLLVLVALVAGCGGTDGAPSPATTPVETSAVSGTVYKDENGDGVYNAGADVVIPGVTVGAYLGSELIAVDDTDARGEFTLYAPSGMGYTLVVSLLAAVNCYDPEFKAWGFWDTIEGRIDDVGFPAEGVEINVTYRMLNYGPEDYSWELWHAGPVLGQPDVVLVHGAQISVIPLILELGDGKVRGMPDYEFGQLAQLLQRREHGQFDVWEFEYADVESFGRYWTHGSIIDYGDRLGTAIGLIRSLSDGGLSIVAHSMGGLVSRYAAQHLGGVERILTLATGHFGFEYTWLATALLDYPGTAQMEAGSDFLRELNTSFQHGEYQLASIAASEDEPQTSPLEGVVRYSSASMVQCSGDGNVTYDLENTYFTVVPGTHSSIKEIDLEPEDDNKSDDFVFESIEIFLQSGVSDALNMWSNFVYPGDCDTRPYFSLRFEQPTPEGYPVIWVNGRRIYSFDLYTVAGDRVTWTFRGRSGEEGLVKIDYAGDEFTYGWLTRGQSTIMTEIIDN